MSLQIFKPFKGVKMIKKNKKEKKSAFALISTMQGHLS